MKTKHQLLVDNFIAKPIAFVLNFLVRIAGKLLFINHSLDRRFERIVICKFKGLGSIIQATPMITAIRQKFPEAEITFVSTKSNDGILKKIKTIDSIVIIDDSNWYLLLISLIKAQFTLIRKRPQVYIDLEIYSNFSTLVALFSLARNRVGFYLRSSKYKLGIYTHMMFFNTRLPVSDVYLEIARLFGDFDQAPPLYDLSQDAGTKVSIVQKNKYILINPNASDLRIERRWDRENFVLLCKQLLIQYPDFEIILIGNRQEKNYTDEIVTEVDSGKVKSMAGKTTIDELIALIANTNLMITNDTGPMHISFACNTPTICLFGPCSPDQYGWPNRTKIIYKKIYCSPCVHDFILPPCKGDNKCMKLITVTEVLDAVAELI